MKDKRILILTAVGIILGVAKDLVKGAESDIKRDASIQKAVAEYFEKEKKKQ